MNMVPSVLVIIEAIPSESLTHSWETLLSLSPADRHKILHDDCDRATI